MNTRVVQGALILPERIVSGGQIVVADGLIQDVLEDARFTPTVDVGTSYIAPGFIDLHVHGIAGADTMDASHVSLAFMAERFAHHGVTSFLFTTMTTSLDATAKVLGTVRDYIRAQGEAEPTRARAIGVHQEGPWISRMFKGAQDEGFIIPPEEDAIRRLLDISDHALRIVTLAPEQPGAEAAIRLLRAHDVYVSIGHTAASHAETLRAVDLGASHVTHCFNAMTPLHHREPGVVGAALLSGELFAELISDGIHVHPDAMRLLIRTKGRERVMLITDAMAAAERPDGIYALGGQEVVVRHGQARLHDGTLAGSTLVYDRAVRNIVELCGVSLIDAIHMASTTPAHAIGLGESKGKIRAGFDADLTILDRDLRPTDVMISGNLLGLRERAA